MYAKTSYLTRQELIVDICLATRVHSGGLIDVQELCHLLCQRRKSDREVVSEIFVLTHWRVHPLWYK